MFERYLNVFGYADFSDLSQTSEDFGRPPGRLPKSFLAQSCTNG